MGSGLKTYEVLEKREDFGLGDAAVNGNPRADKLQELPYAYFRTRDTPPVSIVPPLLSAFKGA